MKGLTPFGIKVTEDWLSACEEMNCLFIHGKELDPEGKAKEILQVMNDAASRVAEIMEA